MRLKGFLVAATLLTPTMSLAQVTQTDTTRPPSIQLPISIRLRTDSLLLREPAAMLPFGRLGRGWPGVSAIAASQATLLQRSLAARQSALWGQSLASSFAGITPGVVIPDSSAAATALAPPVLPGDTAAAPVASGNSSTDLFGQYADLGLQLQSRLEMKVERNKNERCLAADALIPTNNCKGNFQPQFDFQFGVRTGGVVADRVHVNVDYDSQREFDASNNINVFYQGKTDEIIQRLEVGNVSFAPPASRFITNGIPAGNYGIQAVGQLGPMSFRTIVAQQKGNVVKDRIFTVGDQTVQAVDAEIEDNQFERRRFFWVVDPVRAFAGRYPNVDILDPNLASLVTLPDSERPRRVLVYRYRPPGPNGTAPENINGPHAIARGAQSASALGPYEILRQGVDYYIDPSNLWIALVSPINRGERLAVSYTVTVGGQEVTRDSIGGSFPEQRNDSRTDVINLLWDNEVLPGNPVFNQEIRSVYRLGGEDIQRASVTAKIVIGTGSDQEKPVGPNNGQTFDTFLQLFGLAQRTNSSSFDVDNRLWPRLGDPNQSAGTGGGSSKLIRDYYIVFPSLRPFADSGLVHPPNPVNDSLYRTADEDLVSQRRPPTQYHIRVHYSAQGGGDAGTLPLGGIQIRPNSERISIDGRQLTRDVDYTVDYELGRVVFLRPDTLFPQPRQVAVQYEENPLFAAAPTSIFGFAGTFPFQNGQLNLTAISQSQKTTFNRPPLGFEPASSLVAGVNGAFSFESAALTNALNHIPFVNTNAGSSINVQGEFATSRPQPNAAGVAYVESFEGEGGITIPLQESIWRYGSRPATPNFLLHGLPYDFPLDSASTLAWQNLGQTCDNLGRCSTSETFPSGIDSAFVFTGGTGFTAPEPVLWLTLYPRTVSGSFYNPFPSHFQWQTPAPPGRHWRSLTLPLSSSGIDLSRVEQLEFYTLVDTTAAGRRANPTMLFDFGDISESSVYFAPESLSVQTAHVIFQGRDTTYDDSLFTGRVQVGADRLVSERDSTTNAFDVTRNDTGLPGDLVPSLFVSDYNHSGRDTVITNYDFCVGGNGFLQVLGDTKSNCTVANRRPDENDLDLDRALNLTSSQRNDERLLRYSIDLSDASLYSHIGRCYPPADLASDPNAAKTVCWVRVRVPFTAPTDSINSPLRRRIKAMRITLVSSPFAADTDFVRVGLARLKLTGSPWLKRGDGAIAGVAGSQPGGGGFVLAGVIGTSDRDSASSLIYESPPGVVDEADTKQSDFATGQIQINEKSLRLVAGDVPLYHRAEAFFRFPEGDKNFMGYTQLRIWARGRGKGWGPNGDLQFFVKVGRDQDNFYLYRTPANEGPTRDAWLPEVVVDFNKFYALRAEVQNNFLRKGTQIACTGLDSALVASSAAPLVGSGSLYAACDDGYIVYTANPGISAPNLAAVQELAVGFLRADTLGLAGGRIVPSDTLELWVDDIRLSGVVNTPGYAGQFGVNVVAADVGTFSFNMSRKDKNFRQLAEQPTYITDDQLSFATSLRLEKFLPERLGLALPFSASYSSSGSDPFFLSRSDLLAGGIAGLRTPHSSATAYSLSMRRLTPIDGPVLGTILNNLSLSGSYSSGRSTDEFSVGDSRAFTGSLDYNFSAPAHTVPLPGWFDGLLMHLPGFLRNSEVVRQLQGANFRWNPAALRFSSSYTSNLTHRTSFSLPIALDSGDRAQEVLGMSRYWRNLAALDLRPFNALSAHIDFSSLRDLRDYSDSTAAGVLAGQEGDRLLGVGVGLERERQMNTALSFAPNLSSWIRPRIDFSTSYNFQRDPNAQRLLRTADSAFRLPRRLSNSQGFGASASIDLGRGIMMYTSDSSFIRRYISNIFQPLDISWQRSLRSTYDGVPFTPGFGYQLPFGGTTSFRSLNGVLATSAGASRVLTLSHSLNLPLGVTVVDRYEHSSNDSWARFNNTQTLLEGEHSVFPDLSVRVSLRPRFLQSIITSIGAQVGTRVTHETSFQPSIGSDAATGTAATGGGGLRSDSRTTSIPVNGSIAWTLLGGMSTSGGFSKTNGDELRSGGVTQTRRTDINADIGKPFTLPKSWNLKSNILRTRIGYTQSRSQVFFVTDDVAGNRRITDNGRWAVNANADADINENLSFSFALSRVLSFDNLYDRRFSQTVVSAILHLQFFAGQLQ